MALDNAGNEQKKSIDSDNKAADQTQSPATLPPPSTRPTKAELPPTPHSYQITCKTEKDWRDRAKFWAECLGLLVLIVYTVFTGLMWCANKTAADAAQRAATEAQKSREQSETTFKAMVEQFHLDQRARVGVPRFNIGPPTVVEIIANTKLLGNGEFENFGKTPAIIDGGGVKFEVRTAPVPDDFVYPYRKPGRFLLYPAEKGVKTNDDSYTIAAKDFAEVKKVGERRLVLHGVVYYHDTFGTYTTRFCFYWIGEGRLFSPCFEHNTAD